MLRHRTWLRESLSSSASRADSVGIRWGLSTSSAYAEPQRPIHRSHPRVRCSNRQRLTSSHLRTIRGSSPVGNIVAANIAACQVPLSRCAEFVREGDLQDGLQSRRPSLRSAKTRRFPPLARRGVDLLIPKLVVKSRIALQKGLELLSGIDLTDEARCE